MSELHTQKGHCPYCGELIELLLDDSVTEQSYIEDCSVCCRPIVVQVSYAAGDAQVQLFSEND